MTDQDFRGEARRLIWDQLRDVYHIMHLYRYQSGVPFHEFLTGGARTGKTIAVRVIDEAINRMHGARIGDNPGTLKVLLVAFTGSAAFNVHGTTIHHAFRIPFGCKLLPYRRLPAQERSRMRDSYIDLLCLMIDEISMTGATLLYYLHRRLQDVFENNLPFGGIPVLACGDLYQLKPVGEGYGFQGIELQDSNERLFSVFNIRADLFCMYELSIVLRQKHGLPFTEALKRLRVGDHTEEDIELLKRFEIDPANPPSNYSICFRHIFSTHRQRDDHNQLVFKTTMSDELHVSAKDSVLAAFVHDNDKRFFLQKAKLMDESKTATLLSVLHLKAWIILEVTTNVSIPDGLYNGAWGFLRRVDPPGTSTPDILWVEFADISIDRRVRTTHKSLYDAHPEIRTNYVPIFKIARTFQATLRQESSILRWQFLVRPATAGTFHHNQGLSLREGAVNFRGPNRFAKMAGRHYVGYSRFSSPEGHLFVLDSAFEEIHIDPRVHVEMNRLRAFGRKISIFEGLQKKNRFPLIIQCVVHNTRSLPAHIDDIRSDPNILAVDVLVITEARVRPSTQLKPLHLPGYVFECGENATATNLTNVMIYHKDHDSEFARSTACAKSNSEFTIKYDTFSIPKMSDRFHLISIYLIPLL
jgi:hypothetical protein